MSLNRFDPERERELLLNPVGGYEWSLKHRLENSQACGGLRSSADFDLGTAIECLLVGFDEPARRLLEQATEWVQVAIETDERPERYFPDATEASRFETLALCKWLLFNQHDADSLRHFVATMDQCINAEKRLDKIDISLGIAAYVDAGAFERTLEIFARTPGLSAPKSLAPRSEAQMAYILARHHLGLEYTAEDVQMATTKFLSRNINTWLTEGHAVRAAQWLKVLQWNDTDRFLSAKQVLLKAYDYLPGVCSPD